MTVKQQASGEIMPHEKTLLIVDDDKAFLTRLGRAMESRGFEVRIAGSVEEGQNHDPVFRPGLRRGRSPPRRRQRPGRDLRCCRRLRPEARAVVLTGYGNIVTAVTAVKLGAVDYLAKPADADDIQAALLNTTKEKASLPENPMSADRVRWEHIQRIYEMCGRNVSETARRLNMHRRTLQRILAKRAPK